VTEWAEFTMKHMNCQSNGTVAWFFFFKKKIQLGRTKKPTVEDEKYCPSHPAQKQIINKDVI
jgi:hypothetical protein